MKTFKQTHVEQLIARKVGFSVFEHEMSKIGVYVVKPKESASAVFYRDERRFFPQLNDDDIVVGGYFG